MSEILLIVAVLIVAFLIYKYFSLKAEIETRAREQYETWKEKDLQSLRKQYQEKSQKEATQQFKQWKEEHKVRLRKEATQKSSVVIPGKVTEQVVPLFPGFQHNPKDARFIGTPVDFIVFDGLDEGEVHKITFVEVKVGSSSPSSPSPREKQIRNTVEQRLVEWEELHIPAPVLQNHAPKGEILPEANSGKICLWCGKGNRGRARFCGHCGTLLGGRRGA